MTCLCITGSSVGALSKVEAHLNSMGVARLNAANLEDRLTMSEWHDQVVSGLTPAGTALPLVSQPGTRWDLLAANILGSNLKARVIGWQDPRSLQALDYWHDFDQNIRFILVTTSAEQTLIDEMAVSNGMFQSEVLLKKWRQQHEAMLRFYYRNINCCVLIDAGYCLKNLKQFKLHIESKFDLTLTDTTITGDVELDCTSIQRFFTQQILQKSPQTLSLQSEIDHSVLNFELTDQSPTAAPSETSIDSLINDYCFERFSLQSLCVKQTLERAQAKLKIDELKVEGENYFKLHHETQFKNIVLSQELASVRAKESALQDLLDAQKSEHTSLSTQYSALLNENQVLILQLHESHVDLERYFSKLEKAKDTIALYVEQNKVLADEKVSLELIVSEKTQALSDLKALYEKSTIEIIDLSKLIQELSNSLLVAEQRSEKLLQINGQLSIQLQILEEKLNNETSKSDALLIEVELEKAEKADLSRKIDAQSIEVRQAIEQLNRAKERITDLQIDLETQKKNRSTQLVLVQDLVQQLHQSQTEVESEFEKNVRLLKDHSSLNERWNRLLTQNTEFFQYEKLQFSVSGETEQECLHGVIHSLDFGSYALDYCEFDIVLEGNHASLVFSQNLAKKCGLTRWPAFAAHLNSLTFSAMGDATNGLLRATCWQTLSTTDFALLRAIAKASLQGLQAGTAVGLVSSKLNEALQLGLENLLQFMAAIPAGFRYDAVGVERPIVHEDYEALWLKFDNVSFEKKLWKAVEVRLSCASLTSYCFGARPKLEFPTTDGVHLFESWYPESIDDFGPKLELRFESPGSIDTGVWNLLKPTDQNILLSFVEQLPHALREIKATGLVLDRPLIEWESLAEQLALWLQAYFTETVTVPNDGAEIIEVDKPVEASSDALIQSSNIESLAVTKPPTKSSKAFQAFLEAGASS